MSDHEKPCCGACAQGGPCGTEPCPDGYVRNDAGRCVPRRARPAKAGGSWSPMRARPTGPLAECPPLAWQGDRLVALVHQHLALGRRNIQRLTRSALETLWPKTPAGKTIPWGALPTSAAPCLGELERFVAVAVRKIVADADYTNAAKRYHHAAMAATAEASR